VGFDDLSRREDGVDVLDRDRDGEIVGMQQDRPIVVEYLVAEVSPVISSPEVVVAV
jgi:hypothetical protein